MAAYDDLNTKRIFNVGVASVVITAVTALAVQVVYYWMAQIQNAETSEASDYRRQNMILEEQAAEISNYGVDKLTGNIIIPVEKAMETMANENERKDGGREET